MSVRLPIGFRQRRRPPPPRAQRGAALIMTLVLILVMSLLGAFAARQAMQHERSIKGLRSAQLSREAAELALRFCEQVALADAAQLDFRGFGVTVTRQHIIAAPLSSESDAAARWRDARTWADPAFAIRVPAAYTQGTAATTASASPDTPAPLCLIQTLDNQRQPPLVGYLITARGFASNARLDASGKLTQGAETWLQSVLTRSSPPRADPSLMP